MMMDNDVEHARELARVLATKLYGLLGEDLSAPLNFCVSRPWFRFIEGHDLTGEARSEFCLEYRRVWFRLRGDRS